jgi:N-acetylglucosaminyldiphosphoundecaprenol N-acetyl-beta-D-mannosaminyltransferase
MDLHTENIRNEIKKIKGKIKMSRENIILFNEYEKKEYCHRVDKSQIPTCNIMGVNVAAINMDWLIDFTDKNIKELSGDYMCVSNVHTTVTSYEDKAYCAVQNGGIMTIPDGGPLSTVGQKRGYKSMDRTTGPSYMEEMLRQSAQKGYSHFFYGSTQETLDKLEAVLKEKYPRVKLAGMYSPPFRPLSDAEDKEITEKINEADADFVWVGLGAPKQEKWMAAHQGKINGFMVGVGAGFDYFVGNINRAPKWMQKSNLEWLYRLIQEPRRLFKRYWHTNTRFIWHAYIKGK